MNILRIASRLKQDLLYHLPTTHPRKILFDHLPKCGGSTLTAYLEAHYTKRNIFSTDGLNPAKSVRLFKEMTKQKRYGYSLIKGHLANELFDYVDPTCLKITVLRYPVDRIISHYLYARRTPNHYLYSSINDSEMSLEDYASSKLSDELQNWYTTHFSGIPNDIAKKNPKESVAKAAEVLLERYDIVGFLDEFLFFIESIRKRANLRYEYRDNRMNVAKDRPRIESIPQSTIAKIESVNHLDIALYRKLKDKIG
jgi:hypothetical protein